MTDVSPVLTTDAPSNANLAVVRSLGRRGIPVGVCGFQGEFNLAFHSRYPRERLILPSPSAEPRSFVDALTEVLATGRYPIVLPTTDRTIQLVSAAREALPGSVVIPIPPRDSLETTIDKARTIDLARRLGVPVPETWCPEGAEGLAAIVRELPFPVIVKPRQTNFLGANGRLQKAGYQIAVSPGQLEDAYRVIHALVPRPIIQTIVHGVGAGVFSLWNRGTPLTWFAHRRLREEDPRGSRASAAISVDLEPSMVDAATRLLKAIRWHGVAMVEFKHDAASGRFWLMEINGRFWGSLALAIAAGADFPYYLYRLARGEAVEPERYRVGVLARDAVGELKHFVRVMRGTRAAGDGAGPSRLATLRRAGTILHPSRASYNWTPDDPEPGRRELLRFITRMMRGAEGA